MGESQPEDWCAVPQPRSVYPCPDRSALFAASYAPIWRLEDAASTSSLESKIVLSTVAGDPSAWIVVLARLNGHADLVGRRRRMFGPEPIQGEVTGGMVRHVKQARSAMQGTRVYESLVALQMPKWLTREAWTSHFAQSNYGAREARLPTAFTATRRFSCCRRNSSFTHRLRSPTRPARVLDRARLLPCCWTWRSSRKQICS